MPGKCGLMPPGLGPVVQGTLGLMSIAVLTYKCKHDKSGRGTVRFIFDSSKNFGGAAWMHVANLMVAGFLGAQAGAGGDACQWYFIEIMIDTTLGVYVEFKLLEGFLAYLRNPTRDLEWVADMIEAPCIDDTDLKTPQEWGGAGGAGAPLLGEESKKKSMMEELEFVWQRLDKRGYAAQLFSWLAVVTAMKFVMVAIMLVGAKPLELISGIVLNPLTDPSIKLIVVMIFTPGVMNAVQFWLQDNIFIETSKWHGKKLAAQEQAELEASKVSTAQPEPDSKPTSAPAVLTAAEDKDVQPTTKEELLELLKGSGLSEKVMGKVATYVEAQEKMLADLRAENILFQHEETRNTASSFAKVLTASFVRPQKYTFKVNVLRHKVPQAQYVVVHFHDGQQLNFDMRNMTELVRSQDKPTLFVTSEPIALDLHTNIHKYNFVIMKRGERGPEVVLTESCPSRILVAGDDVPEAEFDKAPTYTPMAPAYAPTLAKRVKRSFFTSTAAVTRSSMGVMGSGGGAVGSRSRGSV